ncbi:MAG: hypothetical protein DMG90_21410 [Acidobacteria bacterium]|nr:MAG: hypothetical protein DMG90_21410 [Acidobacteriota bacterium]
MAKARQGREIEKYYYHPSGRTPMKGRGNHFGYRAAVAAMDGSKNPDKPVNLRKLRPADFKTFEVVSSRVTRTTVWRRTTRPGG